MSYGEISILLTILGIFVTILFIIVNQYHKILNELTRINNQHPSFPPLPSTFLLPAHLVLMIFARGIKFWERLYIGTDEKLLIANTIARKFIKENSTVILDSGTTIDKIPQILTSKNTKIYTYNLLAAIGVVHLKENIKCYLLPGWIDSTYGATYKTKSSTDDFDNFDSNVIIVSATALSFDEGPLVRAKDFFNKDFKSSLIETAIRSPNGCTLVIACDLD